MKLKSIISCNVITKLENEFNWIMILKICMCNQFDIEIIQLYKKGMMCDIKKRCVFIYILLTICIITWGGGQMIKTSCCDGKGENLNPFLDMLW